MTLLSDAAADEVLYGLVRIGAIAWCCRIGIRAYYQKYLPLAQEIQRGAGWLPGHEAWYSPKIREGVSSTW